jgi:hypothetical protein
MRSSRFSRCSSAFFLMSSSRLRRASSSFSSLRRRSSSWWAAGSHLPVFQILINFIRIRIRHFRLHTDPNPGVLMNQKIEKNSQQKFFFLFNKKNHNLSIPRPHKGRPSYRRSLRLSKENIQHFKT